jgi:ELWxxDGT repeat protein
MASLGGWLYFDNGAQLWKTDGTLASTVMVKDIYAANGAYVSQLVSLGGQLAFLGDDGLSGDELWRSDGTATGTVRVKDINPGMPDAVTNEEPFAVAFNGRLYFTATDGTGGYELWSSDLTEAGTQRVLDIFPGAEDAYPRQFVVHQGALYFTANDGAHGLELFRSDGTTAGTRAVGDLNPGPANGAGRPVSFGDALVLVGDDGVHGIEPWLYRPR